MSSVDKKIKKEYSKAKDKATKAFKDKESDHKHKSKSSDSSSKNAVVSMQEYEEIKTKYLRALADYENLEKRSIRDKEQASMLANEVLIEKLIPVLDDLDEAIKHIDDDGLKQVQKKLVKALEDSGLEIINPQDSTFNPDEHEAIESVNGKENLVVKVYRKGYRLGNKVLRPALVAVGNGNA